MTVSLDIPVENIDQVIADGYTSIRLWQDTTPTGAFATQVDSETLVADQQDYTLEDTGGTVDYWYRYDFYDLAVGASAKSDPWKPVGTTWATLRVLAAMEASAGFKSTCSALGTATSLIDTALKDQGVAADFLSGAWLYRPNAAAAGDKLRRMAVSAFNVSAGSLTPVREWTNAPASGEVYHVFALLPPVDTPGISGSWDRSLRDGVRECWFVDQLNLGEGDGSETRYALTTHLPYASRELIRRVMARTTASNGVVTDVDYDTHLRYWDYGENGPFDKWIEMHPPPASTQTVIVEVNRHYAEVYADDDVSLCPETLAARAGAWQAYTHLDRLYAGRYKGEAAAALARFSDEYGIAEPDTVTVG